MRANPSLHVSREIQTEPISFWENQSTPIDALTLSRENQILGPPVVPFYPFLGEGSPAKIDYRKKLVPLF